MATRWNGKARSRNVKVEERKNGETIGRESERRILMIIRVMLKINCILIMKFNYRNYPNYYYKELFHHKMY
jgi:hypothetical protein